MDLIAHLGNGLWIAVTPFNLLCCFVGVLIGTLIGVLPGIGPAATLAMLLPITYHLPTTSALIMLSGIYYGSQYGGSTTAILVNMPGEASSVVTAMDGYAMARKGRAGAALAIAAFGSFFAGTVVTFLIALASPPLSEIALQFTSVEYFSLMVLGLVGAVVLAHGSVMKAAAMVVLGLLLGMVGSDVNSGAFRFTFGIPDLTEGLGFVALSMGMLGLVEVLRNLEGGQEQRGVAIIGRLLPSREEFRMSIAPILRGTALGSVLGLLPGGGALLSSFASYTLEKKLAKDPSRFGKGAIEGVAGPEAANNAGAQASFIPMLTLGIPTNIVMAIMIGAMMIQGVTPGPRILTEESGLFWAVIASMWIGNAMLVIINLPLIGIWVSLLKVPYRLLFPGILLACGIGAYSLNNSTFDILITAGFMALGYITYKLGCEPAPLALGFVLGPMMEENLRRAMLVSRGDVSVFIRSPISAVFLTLAALVLIMVILPNVRRTREVAFQEE